MMRFRSQSGQPSVEKDNFKLDPAEANAGCTNIAATAIAEVEIKSFLEIVGILQG